MHHVKVRPELKHRWLMFTPPSQGILGNHRKSVLWLLWLICPGCAVKDYGNLTFEEVTEDEPVCGSNRVRAVGSANHRLSEAVRAAKEDGHTAVMLGGDHRWVNRKWRGCEKTFGLFLDSCLYV